MKAIKKITMVHQGKTYTYFEMSNGVIKTMSLQHPYTSKEGHNLFLKSMERLGASVTVEVVK